ncbi:MAG: glycogen/starch synthase [Desulfosarcina sp.]
MIHILMVAAENGALSGGKVGGIGDVVRDVPMALADQGCRVSVVTPAYGFLQRTASGTSPAELVVHFGGERQTALCHAVRPAIDYPGVSHHVIDSPRFTAFDPVRNAYRIYVDDPPDQPFASDASKFAFLCLTVAEALKQGLFEAVTHIHLHDWHAALLLFLRAYHPAYRTLQALAVVYTIHNLGLQGIRPFDGHTSSLHAWFPGIAYDREAVVDPRWNAINPMAVGIRLADRVHTVSPSYAAEILQSSERPHFYGGEGLENDLRQAKRQERLCGILNGCTYPQNGAAPQPSVEALMRLLKQTVMTWAGMTETVLASHFSAFARLAALGERAQPPQTICTSIGRLQPQKVQLLEQAGTGPGTGLERMLDALADSGMLILLGTGDAAYERYFTQVCARRENFLFLNGYSDACAEALYAIGTLFVMPSSYEPCGISQLLAMRAGQPCLVHAVGGLRDTVTHNHNGFAFEGQNLSDQVDRMATVFQAALHLIAEQPDRWQTIRRNAAATRFPWTLSADLYIERLYG